MAIKIVATVTGKKKIPLQKKNVQKPNNKNNSFDLSIIVVVVSYCFFSYLFLSSRRVKTIVYWPFCCSIENKKNANNCFKTRLKQWISFFFSFCCSCFPLFYNFFLVFHRQLNKKKTNRKSIISMS